jgi:thiamine-monophosphate kinase
MNDGKLGEFELIERFFRAPDSRPPALRDVILGIGDDAALLRGAAWDRIWWPPWTPWSRAGIFVAGSDARSIGHRALAVNLSDLAAMGATPAWATLALTLPAPMRTGCERFSAGLLDAARAHGVALVGGDTTRGPLTVSVQLWAMCRGARPAAQRRACRRPTRGHRHPGAMPAPGSRWCRATPRSRGAAARPAAELIRRFEYPTPRVAFGLAARGIASAAMDLSDGLVGDLPKLARPAGSRRRSMSSAAAVARRCSGGARGAGARLGAGRGRRLRIVARGAAAATPPELAAAAAH